MFSNTTQFNFSKCIKIKVCLLGILIATLTPLGGVSFAMPGETSNNEQEPSVEAKTLDFRSTLIEDRERMKKAALFLQELINDLEVNRNLIDLAQRVRRLNYRPQTPENLERLPKRFVELIEGYLVKTDELDIDLANNLNNKIAKLRTLKDSIDRKVIALTPTAEQPEGDELEVMTEPQLDQAIAAASNELKEIETRMDATSEQILNRVKLEREFRVFRERARMRQAEQAYKSEKDAQMADAQFVQKKSKEILEQLAVDVELRLSRAAVEAQASSQTAIEKVKYIKTLANLATEKAHVLGLSQSELSRIIETDAGVNTKLTHTAASIRNLKKEEAKAKSLSQILMAGRLIVSAAGIYAPLKLGSAGIALTAATQAIMAMLRK